MDCRIVFEGNLTPKQHRKTIYPLYEETNIKLITFWTNYENTENYIVKKNETLDFVGE